MWSTHTTRRAERFIGLSFLNNGQPVKNVSFLSPLQATSSGPLKLGQIVVAGVFTSDLDFDSKLFGHQGARALFSCLFCLRNFRTISDTLMQCKAIESDNRTIDHIKKCAALYKSNFAELSLTAQKANGKRASVTQNDTFSITDAPGLDIELVEVTKAGVHDIQGITRLIVSWMMQGLKRIEVLQSKSDGVEDVCFSNTIEIAIRKLATYEKFLMEELSSTRKAVRWQQDHLNEVMSCVMAMQETLEVDDLDEETRKMWRDHLEALKGEQDGVKKEFGLTDDKVLMQSLIMDMEQLWITKQTKEELEIYRTKHEGYSSRVVVASLQENGIDMTAYFSGSIVGNQCMKFGENGSKIVSKIKSSMSPVTVITNGTYKGYMDKFLGQIDRIIELWFKISLVIKSAKRQTNETIAQFEKDTDEIRRCINEMLITDKAIPSLDIKLPKAVKLHILLDNHLLKHLKRWGTIGAMDEQSIESAHAIWNALLRQFGNTRGWTKKQLVLREFMFRGAPVLRESIDNMMEKTKRKKGDRYTGERKATAREETEEADEQIDDDITFLPEPELSELEKKINATISIHPMLETDEGEEEKLMPGDTQIKICKCCSKRLLSCALEIHNHEAHSAAIVVLDDAEAAR